MGKVMRKTTVAQVKDANFLKMGVQLEFCKTDSLLFLKANLSHIHITFLFSACLHILKLTAQLTVPYSACQVLLSSEAHFCLQAV